MGRKKGAKGRVEEWVDTAHVVVVNRAQRCEYHKLAVFLVGGGGGRVVLCAELMLVAILVKYESARNFERLPWLSSLASQTEQQEG